MKKSHETKRSIFLSAIRAQAVCFLCAAVLLLIACTIACSLKDPDSVAFPLSLSALYLGAVAGGIAAVRFSGDGLVSGMISGAMTVFLVFLLSLLPFPVSDTESPMSFVYLTMVLPASVIGAAIGHKRKEKPKSKFIRNSR